MGSTYVMNEKNAQWISQRIQRDLDPLDLSKGHYMGLGRKRVIPLMRWQADMGLQLPRNRRKRGERGAWYILDLPHEPTCFMTVDKKLCFGTTDGQIMMFRRKRSTFDGGNHCNVGYGIPQFGADWIRKFIQMMFISICLI